VDSTGRQTITINTPSSVASLGSTKIGDIVNIQNLKIGVIQTVVNTGVDLYDTEGVNLGKGPHTMTGKGALRFVVATTNGSTVFFKILYGVKVK